jgi:hypothetical protein
MDGMKVVHAFTHAGNYEVQVTATGLSAATACKAFSILATGEVSTLFDQGRKQRPN